ncbi:unnamed protein product [Pleuronectes platessa]|uniref:Uncharacterized protein n=1 Tax=Pleuronectes platessa TaxID=8262 RepID=A0A9N7U194_PLEPL|nr:unnamed protein product [Pleuronectes platessa]
MSRRAGRNSSDGGDLTEHFDELVSASHFHQGTRRNSTPVSTILCNTRGVKLALVEKFEWWAKRGFQRHLTGGHHAGKDRQGSGETPRRSGRLFLKEERLAARNKIGFPYNLWPGAK